MRLTDGSKNVATSDLFLCFWLRWNTDFAIVLTLEVLIGPV